MTTRANLKGTADIRLHAGGLGPHAPAADPMRRCPTSLARFLLDIAAIGLAHGAAVRGAGFDRYHALGRQMTSTTSTEDSR